MYLLFAWRYFKAKKSTNAINIIAWISIVAIVFGSSALILVLSVFNGFESLVQSLYSSFYTDLRISPSKGKVLTLTEEQISQIRGTKGIKNFSLIVEEKALLQHGDLQSIVYLKGVDDNYPYVAGVADNMIKGDFNVGNDESPFLVLGAGVENAIGVQSDRNILPLVVYLPRKTDADLIDPMKSLSVDTANTSGAFVIQQDFDNKYVLTNLQFMKRMLDLQPNQYGSVEIAIHDPEQAEDLRDELQAALGSNYKTETRFEQNRSLYAVMRAEKWVIYAVLSLILIVAAFTMIAALTMLVLEKDKDIQVLFALGGDRNLIRKIFLSEGFILSLIGGVIGMLIAVITAYLQINYKLIPLQGGSFLIDYFPVKLQWQDFLLVGITVFVIAMLASWFPANKASLRTFSLRSE